jgi:hypothetical protein
MLFLVVFVIHIIILTFFTLSMQSQSLHENSRTNG